MTERRPPLLAARLLRRVADESLAGDLLEEYRNGRTKGWLWRQSLWALATARFAGPHTGLGFRSWIVQLTMVVWVRVRHVPIPSWGWLFLGLIALLAVLLVVDRSRIEQRAKDIALLLLAMAGDCCAGLLWSSMTGDGAWQLVFTAAILFWICVVQQPKKRAA